MAPKVSFRIANLLKCLSRLANENPCPSLQTNGHFFKCVPISSMFRSLVLSLIAGTVLHVPIFTWPYSKLAFGIKHGARHTEDQWINVDHHVSQTCSKIPSKNVQASAVGNKSHDLVLTKAERFTGHRNSPFSDLYWHWHASASSRVVCGDSCKFQRESLLPWLSLTLRLSETVTEGSQWLAWLGFDSSTLTNTLPWH